jgi:uncharacterized protein
MLPRHDGRHPRILTLPGYMDSGPTHWQSRWEASSTSFRRVTQRDWHRPVLGAWVGALDRALRSSSDPVVLVAHSLGCATAAHWLGSRDDRSPVVGALLVAPADVDRPGWPVDITSFQPMPTAHLGIESTVVASHDDPWVAIERARSLARTWGSRFVDLGHAGHLDSASDVGTWPRGRRTLEALIIRCGLDPAVFPAPET